MSESIEFIITVSGRIDPDALIMEHIQSGRKAPYSDIPEGELDCWIVDCCADAIELARKTSFDEIVLKSNG